MKLHAPFIQLPLAFDAAALADEVRALGEAPWKPHPQGFPGNSMLPLVAVGGDADNEAFAGVMAPTPALLACPRLQQVFASLGATIGRSRLMRLSGMAEVSRHTDQGYYWAERVRVHVPLVTQPTVRFECGDAAVHMAAGECWIFDTWRQHRVLNHATQARIHLVVDTVGGARFWDLVGRGRPHDVQPPGWAPAPIAASPAALAFECEQVNVPAVMTPWELQHHLEFLLDEAIAHPVLPELARHVGTLLQGWRGLWAAHGDAQSARPAYRQAFAAFIAAVKPRAAGVVLRNEMPWLEVVQAMLGRAVVAWPPPAGR